MGNEAYIQVTLERGVRDLETESLLRKNRLFSALDMAAEYYWEQDLTQRFTYIYFSSRNFTPVPQSEFLGRSFWELGLGCTKDVSTWSEYRKLFRQQEDIRDLEFWDLKPGEGMKYYSISGKPYYDDKGQFAGYCGVVRDISDRRRWEDSAISMDLAPIGIGHVGKGGSFIYANRKLCEMLGYEPAELVGKHVADITHPEDREQAYEGVGSDAVKLEKRYIRKDGKAIWVGLTLSDKKGPDGETLYAISIIEDISARIRAEQRYRYLATHDELTGLPNRALFNELLRHSVESARRYSRQFAVMFIDLDRFKQINDSLGHAAGDLLLREMANRFKSCVRGSDVVARFGGDEFAVLLQEIYSEDQVAIIARNLLAKAMAPVEIFGQECRTTISLGIGMYPVHGADGGALLRNADLALYQVKADGKNNYQFSQLEQKSSPTEKIALEAQLHKAIENNELFLNYQAKLDVGTNRISGVEVLLRWQNPSLGLVPPSKFIPLAEELDLIIPIGRWVIKQACQQMKEWEAKQGAELCVSVNLSARQFSDPEFLAFVKETVDFYQIKPGTLEFEITESMVMQKPDRVLKIMQEIKNQGVRIAIDDFGTGYSSLSQLKRFPVDTLKIDRSFIKDVEQSSEDKAITRAIITMGKTLGMTVVAEGVETAQQLEFLNQHGCDEIQGFYFAKPTDAHNFEQLVTRHNLAAIERRAIF